MFEKITGWTFLNEPLTRWAIFTGAMLLILMSWGIILEHIKGEGE